MDQNLRLTFIKKIQNIPDNIIIILEFVKMLLFVSVSSNRLDIRKRKIINIVNTYQPTAEICKTCMHKFSIRGIHMCNFEM